MHLAATHGHPAVLNYLLSNRKAQIVKNNSHENILDIAARSEQREVAAVIAKHERSVHLKTLRLALISALHILVPNGSSLLFLFVGH